MPSNRPATFGEVLRRYRIAAGLSQEALAEAARLSARAISDLERGARQVPRRETVELLADALGLRGPDRAGLETAVVRRRGPRFSTGALAGGGAAHQPYSLPVPPTPFIGETGQVERLAALLRGEPALSGASRLVTLTGPGGVGKTRFALEVASEVQEAFADGVAFVALAAVRDPSLVAAAIAQSLGLPDVGSSAAVAVIKAFLYPRHLLLILDNLEQVMDAAPLVADLLASCPRLRVVVTSRAPLHVRGEQEIPVAPLPVPPPGVHLALDAVARVPAVALFVQRARALDPGFVLTPDSAAAVSEICRRLDGLPLAIELAAARGRLLSPQAIAARLTSRLTLLSGGMRDLPPRQQTLRAVLDWSYDLLTPEEQRAFRQMAVFAGGCTLEAAQHVLGGAPGGQPDLILDLLTALVDKSLLEQEDQPDVAGAGSEPRVTMLETVREYAAERLRAGGDEGLWRRRHALYVLDLAEAAEAELRGPAQNVWLARLAADHDNLRAALAWSEGDDGDEDAPPDFKVMVGLRLCAAVWRFWYVRGHLAEGGRWLQALLARQHEAGPDRVPERARALHGAAVLAESRGDYPGAQALGDEELGLWEARGDRGGMAGALNILGNVAARRGDLARARDLYEQALALWREVEDGGGIATALNNLGACALLQGEAQRAAELSGASLGLRRRLGDTGGVAFTLDTLGSVARAGGESQKAVALYGEALALWRSLDDRWGIATALAHLGYVALDEGEYGRAAGLFGESLALCRDSGNRLGLTVCLEGLGAVAAALVRPAEAARLFGAASAQRDALGAPLPAAEREVHERWVAATRAAAGPAEFAAAWAEGRSLPLEQAVAAPLYRAA